MREPWVGLSHDVVTTNSLTFVNVKYVENVVVVYGVKSITVENVETAVKYDARKTATI